MAEQASRSSDDGSSHTVRRECLDVLDTTLAASDLAAFARLDELGLVVVGKRVESGRAVLASRVAQPDAWCRPCGCEHAARDSATRRLALTEKQNARIEALFAADAHVEVEAPWGIYQRMISAYRHADRATGRALMEKLIASVSSGVPAALSEIITIGRTLKKRARGVVATSGSSGRRSIPASARAKPPTRPGSSTAVLGESMCRVGASICRCPAWRFTQPVRGQGPAYRDKHGAGVVGAVLQVDERPGVEEVAAAVRRSAPVLVEHSVGMVPLVGGGSGAVRDHAAQHHEQQHGAEADEGEDANHGL